MSGDPFAPLGQNAGAASRAKRKAWDIVTPVPPDAPPLPKHYKLGAPTATWTYRNAGGAVLGYVLRFDGRDGKQFRPLTLWRPKASGAAAWRWESWPLKRPLYGLERLAQRLDEPVLICEGEKSADAATRLLSGFVAVSSPNGSQSAHAADWKPLRGRHTVIWPDADLSGARYADAAANELVRVGAASVAIVSPPDGFIVIAKPPEPGDRREIDWSALRGRTVTVWPAGDPDYARTIVGQIEAAGAAVVKMLPRPDGGIEGWDAADALAQGWTPGRAAELIATAKRFDPNAD